MVTPMNLKNIVILTLLSAPCAAQTEVYKYVDKDGIERKAIEVVADEINMLDRANMGSDGANRAGAPAATDTPTPVQLHDDEVDDLPF